MIIKRAGIASLIALIAAPLALAADSDNDGLDDNTDNCTLVVNPAQRDSNGDGFGNMCDADFNNDGDINAQDLGIMKANFFSANADTDLNGDNITNIVDLGMLKDQFFGIPGPTGGHPEIDECNCYFSGDCAVGFCDWGPGSFTVEDNCWWRVPKPNGIPGNNCDTEHEGGPGPICDGYCTAPGRGSSVGTEAVDLMNSAIGLWADALIEPSARGGGPVDEQYAQAAQSIAFVRDTSAMEIGRHVADLLSMASDFGFYDYFCHYESYPDEPGEFVDIQDDACRIHSARLAVAALQAEMGASGSGAAHIAQVSNFCAPQVWEDLFAPRCKPGADALACFSGVVADMAIFLSTPRVAPAGSNEAFMDLLRAAQ